MLAHNEYVVINMPSLFFIFFINANNNKLLLRPNPQWSELKDATNIIVIWLIIVPKPIALTSGNEQNMRIFMCMQGCTLTLAR